MANVKQCPNCEFRFWWDKETKAWECPDCPANKKKWLCTDCLLPEHKNKSCQEAIRLENMTGSVLSFLDGGGEFTMCTFCQERFQKVEGCT